MLDVLEKCELTEEQMRRTELRHSIIKGQNQVLLRYVITDSNSSNNFFQASSRNCKKRLLASLANTVHKNTTHTHTHSICSSCIFHYMFLYNTLTITRPNTGTEVKVLQKRPLVLQSIFCSSFPSAPVLHLMTVNVYDRTA